ncbi:MAG: translesion DNA synthesis-associated protein ImuA [Gammaproteobacteria bacterium]|nr:translesion DNA synthesis-associated protein ImuA [Gammaproteobacteria bacterium]
MELLLDQLGIGELRLLTPALTALSEEARWLAWINPPHIPYAPALSALGIDVGKVLLVHPQQHQDALWSVERTLRSGTCSAVMAWLDESRLRAPEIRRLKLAAREGNTLAVLFRPLAAAAQPSMAELRLGLTVTGTVNGMVIR